jgi:O-antigen/teichoic acid export membrane protein
MSEQCLKDKAVKGVGWSAAETFLGQGVTFIVGLLLARLLSPEEYGLIGIVTIFNTILMGFIDCGFSNALIRKTDADDNDYNTMFIVNFAMSVVMYCLLYVGAPFIALFFERPQLTSVLRVSGLLLIIMALSIVHDTILKKRIDFKTRTKASFIAAIIGGIIGVSMAFMGLGVWSLVGQLLSRQGVYTLSLWIFNRWWPKKIFSSTSMNYMWGFGWKLLVSGLINRLWNELYQIVVAKCYSPATLGQYTRSKEYAKIFSSILTNVVQRVSYPVLAQIQDDKERMVSGYRRIIKATMFVTVIILISMGAVADPLIYCLIGPQWHIAATFLPLICLNMSLYPLHAINLNMLQIQGRSDLYLYLEIAKKVIAVGPICIGIFVDIYWMLVASVFTGIISFFLNSFFSGRTLGYSSWMQVKDIAPSYLVAFIVAIPVYYLKYLPFTYWIILPMQIIVGISIFFLICKTIKMSEYEEMKGIACLYIRKILKHS